MTSARSTLVAAALACASLAAPAGAAPEVLTLEVDARVVAAARELGPDVVFFTARAQPLSALATLGDPAVSVGTADVGLARPLIAVLRAGGLGLRGGAFDLMRLTSEPHFSRLFQEEKGLRLFVLRARADGSERAIAERGGGVRLILRARGGEATIGAAATAASAGRPAPEATTSFGTLVRSERAATARQRSWDAVDGAAVQERRAHPGRTFVVLHLDRDVARGVGMVSFLFGSGTVVKPAFERLVLRDAAGKRYLPVAVFAEGRTLELGYEVPAAAAGLRLEDGDRAFPVAPALAAP
jgi:hypothetical protein